MDTSLFLKKVEKNKVFKFRVRAYNVYGEGEWSESVDIKSGAVPGTMAMLKAANPAGDDDATKIVVTWEVPNTNGSPITEYEILIKKKGLSNDDFRPAGLLCDGSDSTIVSTQKCTILSQTLKDNWGYIAGDKFVG